MNLLHIFNPLCHHIHVKAVSQLDHIADNISGTLAFIQEEGSVQLQRIHLQGL